MKIKPNLFIMFFALAAMAFSLVACDTRPIPGGDIITTYNSDLEETKEFVPMDTMYVKVAGMKPNKFYQVSVLDADKRTITKIEARTNDEGIIDPMPLWYDMGLKVSETNPDSPPTLVWPDGLEPVGFKINIKSLYDNGESTDFTQDMWIVYKKSASDTNPKPVVYSCYSETAAMAKAVADEFYPENAFKETGSLDVNGNPDPKTVVCVKADRVPTKIGNTDVESVDFYVIKFTGGILRNGENLNDNGIFVTKIEDIDVNVDGTVDGTPLWNLNEGPTRINPDQDNMAYSIVMDVDRDGYYDQGIDTNSDGVSDHFIDGVDGNGSPGFIIQNTPANNTFVTIKDQNGNVVNVIPESGTDIELNINIDNVPAGPSDHIDIYLIDSEETGGEIFALNGDEDVRSLETGGDTGIELSVPAPGDIRYLPYLQNMRLLNTTYDDEYSYDGETINADTQFDIVIDVNGDGEFNPDDHDIFVENALTILDVPETGDFFTCAVDTADPAEERYFDETGTVAGYTSVFLNATNNEDQDFDVYIFPDRTWVGPTYDMSGEVLKVTGLEGNDNFMIWDLNGLHQVINPTNENNTYDIVIDKDRNGEFNGTDEVLTIVILNTEVNTYPRVSYVNIASGGAFGNTWEQHWTIYSDFCDYRDVFVKNGLDTNPYGAGYGVKAVFNPYFSWFCNPDPETPIAGMYYGLYVDVYIVNAATFDLSVFGHRDELNDSIDVTGQHSTLVVQPSCYNGAGMMNIWPAEMTPGRYYVIVDVNMNGRIDEGIDIIDAVKEDGTTILDDPSVVGFTVQ